MKIKGKYRFQEWALFLCAVFLAASSDVFATEEDDDYNFNWLDPDKKVYVLQNRRYTKAKRVAISLMGGTELSSPYRTARSIEPRVSYFFNEQLGVEGFYQAVSNSVNNTANALAQASGTAPLPVIREIKSQMGVLLKWAPWYAKINVFNSVLYFDWYFTGGAGTLSMNQINRTTTGGVTTTTSATKTAFYLGTGHEFHMNEHFDVRWDFTGAFYQAPIYGTTGETAWFSNFVFSAGLGWRI